MLSSIDLMTITTILERLKGDMNTKLFIVITVI
jgi:hypothetical protein